MEKQLAEGKLGAVGSYDVDYKDGAIVAVMEVSFGPLSHKSETKLDAVSGAIAGLKAAKDLIPGQIDDVLLNGAISALEALKSSKVI